MKTSEAVGRLGLQMRAFGDGKFKEKLDPTTCIAIEPRRLRDWSKRLVECAREIVEMEEKIREQE